MKYIVFMIMLLVPANSFASYVPTSGQSTLNTLNKTPVGSLAYYPVPCQGSGDEQALLTSSPIASTAKTSLLIGDGCQTDNQWVLSGNTYTSVFGWGGTTTDVNTGQNVIPRLTVYTPGIAANAPGQAAIDVHGPAAFSLNAVNIFGSDIGQAATLIENSVQNGNCCAANAVQLFETSLSNANSLIGCPMDANLNCIQAGGVASGTLTSGGSAYTNGTYYKVPLTGGAGTGAYADSVVVSGGKVTTVTLNAQYWGYPGSGYGVGNVLSASNANLGSTGSGFSFTVASVMKATPTAPNTLIRITKSQMSNFGGCGICLNSSDLMVYNSEFTGSAGVAIQTIFGGGGNQIANNRLEYLNSGIWLGGPNAAGAENGSSFISNNFFTHTQSYDTPYRTSKHFDIDLGGGNGFVVSGDVFDQQQTTDPSVILGGGPVALVNVAVTGSVWGGAFGGGANTNCIDIKTSLSSVNPDYLFLGPIVCNGGAIVAPINYEVVPAHFVEDSIGPGGQHAEKGRPFGIGTSAPNANATLDLGGDTKAITVPIGTTGQRPTATTGMMRYNSTTNAFEGYFGSWSGSVGAALATPTDAQACAPGQMWTDTGFIYVCTASGTVKRAALSTF